MPAPPYSSGICMPNSPISAMGAITSWGKRSSRSQRAALGMISRSHSSRTDFFRISCSSLRSKFIWPSPCPSP